MFSAAIGLKYYFHFGEELFENRRIEKGFIFRHLKISNINFSNIKFDQIDMYKYQRLLANGILLLIDLINRSNRLELSFTNIINLDFHLNQKFI